jgi:hypothetical protein
VKTEKQHGGVWIFGEKLTALGEETIAWEDLKASYYWSSPISILTVAGRFGRYRI